MNTQDLKIYLLNTFSLSLSMSNIETALKLCLLLVSLVYTGVRLYKELRKPNEKNQ